MSNLAEFMSTTPNDIPDPIEIKEGKFRFEIQQYRAEEAGKDKDKWKVTLKLQPVEVIDAPDFNEEDLELALPLWHSFWLTPKALAVTNGAWSAKTFLRDILDLPGDLDFTTLFEMSLGQSFEARTKVEYSDFHKADQTSIDQVFAN